MGVLDKPFSSSGVMLFHRDSAVQTPFLLFLCAFVVKNEWVLYCNYSSGMAQIAQRRQHGSHPRHLRHFSAMLPRIRRTKLSIQRRAPSHPPAISADVLQIVQQLQRILHFVLS
jgi:hypothetical protein